MSRDLSAWQSCPQPSHPPLLGQYIELQPLNPQIHGASLWQVLHSPMPDQWQYMAYGPFSGQLSFQQWINSLVDDSATLFYSIVDNASGQALGLIAYLRIAAKDGCLEIGHLNFSSALQRTRGASEAVYLLLREAFEQLGYRRVEWKCNALNLRSIRAAERYGFVYEGLFRQHMVVKGQNRDSAWFAMLDQDWPTCQQAFEQWLSVDNFNPQGKQIHSLRELRQALIRK